MALSSDKFKGVASKLFGKAKLGGLTESLTLEKPGAIDPITGASSAGASQTVDAIREMYKSNEVGELVKQGDYKLLVEAAKLTAINPREDGINATLNGATIRLVNADIDTANAVWTLQMRDL